MQDRKARGPTFDGNLSDERPSYCIQHPVTSSLKLEELHNIMFAQLIPTFIRTNRSQLIKFIFVQKQKYHE